MALAPGTIGAKSAALLLLVLALFLGDVVIVSPLIAAYKRQFDQVKNLKNTLDQHTGIANEAGTLRRELAKLQSDGRFKNLMLKPASEARAAADIQNTMEILIQSAGARLSSVQALPVQPSTGMKKIGLRLQFSAANQSLRKILHELEYGRPVSLLDNVFIHSATAKSITNTLPELPPIT